MQNLDPAGNYSDDEVKEALSGAKGSRDWSFRYERLDKNNQRIEDIDFVESCTIDNNIFADIKRTAKFRIYDQGNINYLSDRIKPYVRLSMPATKGYGDMVNNLDPALWWKFDDKKTAITVKPSVTNDLPDNLTYSTRETALPTDPSKNIHNILFTANTSVTTIRSELWVMVNNNSSDPFYVRPFGPAWDSELYYSSNTEGSLELVETRYGASFAKASVSSILVSQPKLGIYYLRVVPNTNNPGLGSVAVGRHARIEDASRYKSAGVTIPQTHAAVFGGEALIQDGGSGINTNVSGASGTSINSLFEASNLSVQLKGGLTVNYWTKYTRLPNQIGGILLNIDTDTQSLSFNINDRDVTGGPQLSWGSRETTGSVTAVENTTIRSFSGEPLHMFTFVVEPDGMTAHFYIDGRIYKTIKNFGKFSSNKNYDDIFSSEYIRAVALQVYSNSGGRVQFDDLSIIPNTVSRNQIAQIYAAGLTVTRSGRPKYVEWPQGVFLLSSPSRVFSEGNSSFREVEAYDQLLVLKEDSYESRYTVRKGANCVEEVEKVVGSITRRNFRQTSNSPTAQTGLPNAFLPQGGGVTATVSDFYSTDTRPDAAAGSSMYRGVYNVPDAAGGSVLAFGSISPHAYGKVVTLGVWMRSSRTISVATNISDGEQVNHVLVANKWTRLTHTERIPNLASTNGPNYEMYMAFPTGNTTVNITETIIEEGTTAGPFFSVKTPNSDAYTYSFLATPNGSGYAIAESKNHHVVPSPQTFTEAMEWEPGTSKLQIVNDILAYINYESAWYNEDGGFIGAPYMSPAQRGSEFTYATDAESVITSDDISQTLDLFSIPNKWVLVVSDPEAPPMVGSYTNEDPMSPTSTVSRGRTIVDYRTEESASDLATLAAKAERLAFETSQVYEKVEFSTGLMPIHSNADTYDIIVDELAISNKYNETAWSMELSAGSTMKHQVRRIIQI